MTSICQEFVWKSDAQRGTDIMSQHYGNNIPESKMLRINIVSAFSKLTQTQKSLADVHVGLTGANNHHASIQFEREIKNNIYSYKICYFSFFLFFFFVWTVRQWEYIFHLDTLLQLCKYATIVIIVVTLSYLSSSLSSWKPRRERILQCERVCLVFFTPVLFSPVEPNPGVLTPWCGYFGLVWTQSKTSGANPGSAWKWLSQTPSKWIME